MNRLAVARVFVVALGITLLTAACGTDSAGPDDPGRPGPTTSQPPTTAPPTTQPPTTQPPKAPVPDGSGCTPGEGDLPDGRWYGFVAKTDADELEFDLACWFSGKDADKAAAEDGEESPAPNGYYVRNENPATRTVTVAKDVQVLWYENVGDPATEDTIPYAEWVTESADRDLMLGIWIEVDDGSITDIQEQYVP